MRAQQAAIGSLTDLLFERANVGLCLVSPDGTILRTNTEWLRSTGLALDQILGERILDLFPDMRDMHARARAGHHVLVPRHVRCIDGRETWWEGSIDPVSMDGGLGLLVMACEAPAATSALGLVDFSRHEGDERFRLLADAMAQIVCVLEPDGTPRYVNSAWTTFSGLDLRATIRAGWTGVLHADDVAAARKCRRRALKSRTPQDVELRYRASDGGYRCFLSRLAPVVERGRVIQFVGAAMDIEDRLRAERDLRRREEEAQRQAAELKAVLDAVPAAVFITRDRDARAMDANRFASELVRVAAGLNVSKSAPEGQGPRSFRAMRGGVEIPPDQLPVQLAAATGEEVRGYELDLVFDGGEVRHLLGNATPLRAPDGTAAGAVGAFVDITQRKRAEEALRASEQKFSAIYDHAPCAVVLMQMPRGIITDVNPAWEELFGCSRREALGKTAVELGLVADRQARDRMFAEVAARGSVRDVEVGFFTRGGEQRLGSFSFETIEIDGQHFQLGSVLDVTDNKRAEEALRDADRRKDEFLGMLSHELRNPLAPIRNALYILDHTEPTGQQARRAREIARRQIAHITRLVDDLLDVTRIVRGKIDLRRIELDLAALARRTVDDHRVLMKDRGLELRLVIPPAPVIVNGDETRLAQVLGNLLHNASKFTPPGGEVTVAVGHKGGRAVVHVRDTGVGMGPETLRTIFQPFVQAKQTLARSTGGLGLGLALVKGLIVMHGGDVTARSAGPGRGTEFVLKIPLDRRQAVRTRAPSGGYGPSVTGRRVLVVDDNQDAAETMAELLEMGGHVVTVAHDGPSALAMALARPPDVILCDIGLPGMDGYEVARQLRSAGARGIRLVAVSGYAQPEDIARATEAGFDAHIAKPADPEQLARLLAR